MMDSFFTRGAFGAAPIEACFSDEALAADMAEVEAALARVQASMGLIPRDAADAITNTLSGLSLSSERLVGGVTAAGVPVPALVAILREAVGPPYADHLHFGATSQDIVDTAFCLAYRRALNRLGSDLGALLDDLAQQSAAHRDTLMAGRTRAQLATPITAGLRIAQWAQPLLDLEAGLPALRSRSLKVQFAGASGSQSAIAPHGPAVASALAAELDLQCALPWSTDRSGFRHLSAWLFDLVTALAKMATDLMVSGRNELGEMRAGAGGGSSTMPHKANPVGCEAIVSLSRIALGLETGLAASAVHAEERDGSMWSVEWALLPRLFVTAGAALRHAQGLAGDLRVDQGAMAARIDNTPELLAEAAVFALSATMGRTAAAALVAKALAEPAPFPEALASLGPPGTNWAAILDPSSAVAPAAAVADAIFAARRKPA